MGEFFRRLCNFSPVIGVLAHTRNYRDSWLLIVIINLHTLVLYRYQVLYKEITVIRDKLLYLRVMLRQPFSIFVIGAFTKPNIHTLLFYRYQVLYKDIKVIKEMLLYYVIKDDLLAFWKGAFPNRIFILKYLYIGE